MHTSTYQKVSMEKMMNGVCGLDVALHYIGGKWKPIILFHMQFGPHRFGEIKRLIGGISEKVLIQQLKDLTEHGILIRHDFQEVPPRVEYKITDFGCSLARALQPLCEWGNANRASIVNDEQQQKMPYKPPEESM